MVTPAAALRRPDHRRESLLNGYGRADRKTAGPRIDHRQLVANLL